MQLRYKLDILAALKAVGYSTYRIRKEKILNEYNMKLIRGGKPVPWDSIIIICDLLDCQPGDLIEYIRDDAANKEGGNKAR